MLETQVGLVGKPNVGKSTFFSAATLVRVAIANYPFTTISPNKGVTHITTSCVCKELGVEDNPRNSNCRDGVREIPVELIDCAGLVPGAWEGRGLGNQFLDELRRADALIHVVDASGSTDLEGKPSRPGSNDPLEDVVFLENELDMWFQRVLEPDWLKITRRIESERDSLETVLQQQLSGLGVTRDHLRTTILKCGLDSKSPSRWPKEDLARFVSILRRSTKPVLIAANKSDQPTSLDNLERLGHLPHIVIPTSAEAELALRRAAESKLIKYVPGARTFEILGPDLLSPEQASALTRIKTDVLDRFGSTGVQSCLNLSYFKLLNMLVVYPVSDPESYTDGQGRVLPDAYLMPTGSTILDLAEKLHSDLSGGFLYGIDARTRKRLGREYPLKNDDIVSVVSTRGHS